MEKTEAALLDKLGNVIALVSTDQPAGPCRYYWLRTFDGAPVNTRRGKLSRAKRVLTAAQRHILDDNPPYLVN